MQWEKEHITAQDKKLAPKSSRSVKMDRIYMERQELGREKGEGAANIFKYFPLSIIVDSI
jgi:hypothetical protein